MAHEKGFKIKPKTKLVATIIYSSRDEKRAIKKQAKIENRGKVSPFMVTAAMERITAYNKRVEQRAKRS